MRVKRLGPRLLLMTLLTACQIGIEPKPIATVSTIEPSDVSIQENESPEKEKEDVPTAVLPTSTEEVSVLEANEKPLDPIGPWLVIETDNGIFAANHDGTGITKLVDGEAHLISIAPEGGNLSYIVDSSPDNYLSGLELNLFNVHSRELRKITILQNPELLPSFEEDDYSWEAEQASRAIKVARWSHDGTRLAFVGQINGPSSDLYMYSIQDELLTQLSSGPSQAYNPVWSPDDEYIFHNGVWNFGTGAGYNNAGSWAASSDGNEMIETTSDHGTDSVIRWIDDHKFLMASWSQPCGSGNLVLWDLDEGSTTTIWNYYFSDVSYSKDAGQMVLIVPPDWEWCMDGQPTGVFVFDALNANPEKISENDFWGGFVDPYDPENFLLVDWDARLYRMDQSGTIDPIMDMPDNRPVYSGETGYWAWYESYGDLPGAWIGKPGVDPPRQISSNKVFHGTWSSDGESFFYSEEEGRLYRADAPDFRPIQIMQSIPDVAILGLYWMMP